MFRLLLCALLVHSTVGQTKYVTVTKNYKDPICDLRLTNDKYFSVLSGIRVPTKDNGRINYMWGYAHLYIELLYCARIRSEKKLFGTVEYTLPIPKSEVESYIRSIQVFDMKSPEKGGTVKLTKGEGDTLLNFRFESLKGQEMDFVVSIFGKPKTY